MKLASYADGSRDGHLVVVSRDLTQAHVANHIASRLQQVLDDWGFLAPQLEDLAVQLQQGKLRHAFDFDPAKCLAPLPRAFGWTMVSEGQFSRAPGEFSGPRAPLRRAATAHAHLAALSGDLAAGSDAASARDALRLLTLAVDWRVGGDTWATHAAPLAVTPDEVASPDAQLITLHNGLKLPARPVRLDAGATLAHAARWRALRAGQVVGQALGALDLALAPGDSLRLDLKSAEGSSLFGAIDLDLEAAE